MMTEIRCLEQRVVSVPAYVIGPLRVNGGWASGDYKIPLATVEVPLIPSTSRGIKVANLCGGVKTRVEKSEMTRAPLFTAKDEPKAKELCDFLHREFDTLSQVVSKTTSHGKLTSIEAVYNGADVYARIGMDTGDAAGHNMAEKGAQFIWDYIRNLPQFRNDVRIVSISSNYCTDKKPARINLEKGRGKSVRASLCIPKDILEKHLHTTAECMQELNYKKNIIGSQLAGCVGGNNAHHANLVAAMYLALGQDIANVVEGSLGSTAVKAASDGSMVFGVYLPALIVGTVWKRTPPEYAQKNLEMLGVLGGGNPIGSHAKALAEIIAATVLVGELSLMASLAKDGDLWQAHQRFERG